MADRSVEVMQDQELDRRAKLVVLGESLAGVAHELNNPLTVILHSSEEGLFDPGNCTEAEELFTTIKVQSLRMRDLIRELLGFARPRREQDAIELKSLISSITTVQQAVVGKHVRLRTNFGTSRRLTTEAPKVEQIVVNLISNAADAMGSGGAARVESTAWMSVVRRGYGSATTAPDSIPRSRAASLNRSSRPREKGKERDSGWQYAAGWRRRWVGPSSSPTPYRTGPSSHSPFPVRNERVGRGCMVRGGPIKWSLASPGARNL